MDIQRLGPEEVERFRAIRLRGLRSAPGAFGTTFEAACQWSPDRWSALFSGLVAFVAVTGHRDVGLVRCAPDLDVAGAARLGSLWVAPDARGSGIARALVEAVVHWARAEGFHELLLDVADDNPGAVALYERLGFAPTGKTTSFPLPRAHLSKHQRRLQL